MGVPERGLERVTAPALAVVVAQQATPTQAPILDIVIWIGAMAAVTLVILVVGMMVRKKLLADVEKPAAATPFTLADLRRLHANGQLTDDEFERAKVRIIAQSTRALDTPRRKPAPGETRANPKRPAPLDVEDVALDPADDVDETEDVDGGIDVPDDDDVQNDDVIRDDGIDDTNLDDEERDGDEADRRR